MNLARRLARRVRRFLPQQHALAPPPPNPPPWPVRPTHQLRYTGTLAADEFRAKCAAHEYWYHSYYFDNGLCVRGDYDIGRDVEDYCFPDDLAGMAVLDVGTGSGWFATYLEQRGAKVTTVDARGYCDFDIFGRDDYPDVTRDKPTPDRIVNGKPVYHSPVSGGFWVMKEILGLKAEYVNARIYDLRPELFGGRKFDLVFLGSVLMHLRDPIGGLMAAHRVCRGRLLATSYMIEDAPDATPFMQMRPGAADGVSWWVPNRPCLVEWLRAAGFQDIDLSRRVHLTVDQGYRDEQGNCSACDQVQTLIQAAA
jgi:tRNA (mo5U34)-methyltransferase